VPTDGVGTGRGPAGAGLFYWGCDMAHASWQVVRLIDGEGLPRWVEARCRNRQSNWELHWAHRHEMAGRLAAWFRELAKPPEEQVLLGSGGIRARVAVSIAKLEIRRIVRVCGEWPPWLCHSPRWQRHSMSLIAPSGRVLTFKTLAAAARHEGVLPIALTERITRRGNRAFQTS
jgi:hypothetical protein